MGIKLETIGDKFMLLEDYEIKGYTIPKGFVTDFATIPRWVISLTGRPTRSKFQRASLLHDYLIMEKIISRTLADELFYEILLEDGTGKRKSYIMYLAVRIFGIYKEI